MADDLMFTMAGNATEIELGLSTAGSCGDHAIAMNLAAGNHWKVQKGLADAQRFVRSHMTEIQRLANALEARGTLTGTEIDRLLVTRVQDAHRETVGRLRDCDTAPVSFFRRSWQKKIILNLVVTSRRCMAGDRRRTQW